MRELPIYPIVYHKYASIKFSRSLGLCLFFNFFMIVFISAQGNSLIPKLDTLRKFNIEQYKKKDIDYSIYLEDSTQIDFVSYSDYFEEQVRIKNSPYKLLKYYNIETGNYEGGGIYFYNILVGDRKVYDEKGKLIFKENIDKDYPFTIQEVITKIKKEYGVDLEREAKQRDIQCGRGLEGYYIHFMLNPEEQKKFVYDQNLEKYRFIPQGYYEVPKEPYQFIYIDGTTGEIEMDYQAYLDFNHAAAYKDLIKTQEKENRHFSSVHY